MRLSSFFLAGALICAAWVTDAQQASTPAPASAPAPTSTPAASTPASTNAPASSSSPAASQSATMAQKAKDAGMKQETHGGTTYYCWKEAVPNSRLPEKRCVNEDQLSAELDRRQARREQFQQSAAPGVASK